MEFWRYYWMHVFLLKPDAADWLKLPREIYMNRSNELELIEMVLENSIFDPNYD